MLNLKSIGERYARHNKIRVNTRNTPELNVQTGINSPRITSITSI